MIVDDQGKFVYTDTGKGCSTQEALFHYFGLPIEVVAEPSVRYSYHRSPWIAETSKDRTRVLVRFTAESMFGESFAFLRSLKMKNERAVDRAARRLHDEAFSIIDCIQCSNCCKTVSPMFNEEG